MSRNSLIQETSLTGAALSSVRALLPEQWSLKTDSTPEGAVGGFVDAHVSLQGPTGQQAEFVVTAWRSRSVGASELITFLDSIAAVTEQRVLMVSDYLGPVLRRRVAEAGHSYADATGWVRLISSDPLVLLTGQGAGRTPGPSRPSAVRRFNGKASSRIIRALLQRTPPLGTRELAVAADVSPGSVSKHVTTLAAEGLIDKSDGAVVGVRRRDLLERWTADYDFQKTNSGVLWCLAPRGLERARERLSGRDDVVLTGSAAARSLLPEGQIPVVPLTLLAVYCEDPEALCERVGLTEVRPGQANVVLARPQDPEVLDSGTGSGIAPLGLVLADLLTLPGRSEAEADQLMDALSAHDPLWEA